MCKDLAEVGNWRLKPGKLQGRLLKLLACVLLPDLSPPPPHPLSRGEFFCRGKNNIIVQNLTLSGILRTGGLSLFNIIVPVRDLKGVSHDTRLRVQSVETISQL
jgi:hypothetical protein